MLISTQSKRQGSRHWLEKRFFEHWCEMVRKELKWRYDRDTNVLLGFANWFGITTELQEIYYKPERAAVNRFDQIPAVFLS